MHNRPQWFRCTALLLASLVLVAGCSTTRPLRPEADPTDSTLGLRDSDIGRWFIYRMKNGEELDGHLVSFDTDSITVRAYGTYKTRTIATADVEQVCVVHTHIGWSLLVAAGGTVLGLLLWFFAYFPGSMG